MNYTNQTPRFRYKRHLYILKRLLILANIVAVSIHLIMRAIFYDLPFVLQDELLQVANSAGIASLAAVAVSVVLFAGDGIHYLLKKRKHTVQPAIVHRTSYKLAS